MRNSENQHAGGIAICALQSAAQAMGGRRQREFLTIVVLAISAIVGLAGCATIEQEPEVDPPDGRRAASNVPGRRRRMSASSTRFRRIWGLKP